jgi:hypothetical protein
MSLRRSIARALALAVAGASLLTIAGPASAGDVRATIFVVQGVPNTKVDVCVGGIGELTSKLAYTERDKRKLEAGTYKLKVRTASKGECRGDVVAKGQVTLAELDNVTLVVRPEGAKATIVNFDNDVTPTAPGEIRFVAAHMMKGGPVDVWANGDTLLEGLGRNQTDETDLPADVVYSSWGTNVGETAPIVGPRVIDSTTQGQAYTFVMVGTKVANNRLVIFKQDVGTAV